MTRARPMILALIAASTAAPLAAQDMSRFLDPQALAADLGLDAPSYDVAALQGVEAPRGQALGAPTPSTSPLAPRRSLIPVSRGSVPDVAVAADAAPLSVMADAAPSMGQRLADARAAAPEGANVAVIVSAPRAMINGQRIEVERGDGDSTSWWGWLFGG